ncbi:hypothetical protein [Myxococcus sp. RHSTA-1-4]|uniref:hypothetical protein n=1 Tax=Myxococcus sp. RHSTA-1-4 TaxID=2874601 RepID=UPI001CBFA04C|nr:hypothetical protein [Myxococcus sp. RHSTA-1-4]MBZ4417863.1 hypothetical protein [Myxococcus sp. RHSTA-1-4]
MDQAPPPKTAAEIVHEERRANVQRRIDEAADVLAGTLLGMWRAKHRAERRGQPWPPSEEPKSAALRNSVLSDRPKGPPRRVFRELEARDEPVANMLLEDQCAGRPLPRYTGWRAMLPYKTADELLAVVREIQRASEAALLRPGASRSAK